MTSVPTTWRFALPISILLMGGALLLVFRETSSEMHDIEINAETQVIDLTRLLSVSESLVGEQVKSSMSLLKQRGLALGVPRIRGETSVGNHLVPGLYFGAVPQSNNFKLVDDVTHLLGGTATLFVKVGDDFVRVSTNVQSARGGRATGTLLDPHGVAIQAVRNGKPFYGVVDILGQPYFTGYEPMSDSNGNMIGLWYVGYKVDTQILREAVEGTRFLKSGFSAVLDENAQMRFHSSHISQNLASQIIANPPADWIIVRKYLPTWRFEVLVGYPEKEAHAVSLARGVYNLLILLTLGLLLIVVVSYQFYRLVIKPLGADPAVAADLMNRIALGDLEEDGRKAKAGSLMNSILTLRTNLRELFSKIQHNNEQLSLAASVFEHANDGIFITDATGKVIEVNAAFIKMTGYSRTEAIKETLFTLSFASTKTDMQDEIWPSLSKTGAWHGESRNLRKTGEAYTAALDIFSVRDAKDAVSHYIGVISDITKLKQQQQHLEHMAYHDALTHLPNRTLLSDRLNHALSRLGRSQQLLALCLLDLDGFKPVNDKLGHEAGDTLLVELAQRLTASLRAGDTVARLGGDEFAILLCDLNNFEECKLALRRLLAAISTPFDIKGNEVRVTGSLGMTISPFDDNTPDTLLRHADQAMYQAKMKGGNRYEVFDAVHARRARAHHIELESIVAGLKKQQFQLYYQPKVNLRTRDFIGVEALIRWMHPQEGLLAPGQFLPLIENHRLSVAVGEWVIRQALQQLTLWQQAGSLVPVSVNVSAMQ